MQGNSPECLKPLPTMHEGLDQRPWLKPRGRTRFSIPAFSSRVPPARYPFSARISFSIPCSNFLALRSAPTISTITRPWISWITS